MLAAGRCRSLEAMRASIWTQWAHFRALAFRAAYLAAGLHGMTLITHDRFSIKYLQLIPWLSPELPMLRGNHK